MKTVVIYDFMIKDLKLKGLELLLFAIVYSFAQFGSTLYAHHVSICDFLGCSRSQFYQVRNQLISKGYIQCCYNNLSLSESLYSLFDVNKFPDNFSELVRLAKLNIYED